MAQSAPNKNSGPERKSLARQGVSAWLGDAWGQLVKNTTGLAVAGVLAVVSAGGWLGWTYVNGLIDQRIDAAVINSLDTRESPLAAKLDTIVAGKLQQPGPIHDQVDAMMRASIKTSSDSQIGTMSAGQLKLTSAAPGQSFYIYAPKGHSVRLLLRIDDLEPGDTVKVIPWTGRPMSMKREGLFDEDLTPILLANSASSSNSNPTVNDSAVGDAINVQPDDGEFDNLYSVTIQLNTPRVRTLASTDVRYMVFVTPALSMKP